MGCERSCYADDVDSAHGGWGGVGCERPQPMFDQNKHIPPGPYLGREQKLLLATC